LKLSMPCTYSNPFSISSWVLLGVSLLHSKGFWGKERLPRISSSQTTGAHLSSTTELAIQRWQDRKHWIDSLWQSGRRVQQLFRIWPSNTCWWSRRLLISNMGRWSRSNRESWFLKQTRMEAIGRGTLSLRTSRHRFFFEILQQSLMQSRRGLPTRQPGFPWTQSSKRCHQADQKRITT